MSNFSPLRSHLVNRNSLGHRGREGAPSSTGPRYLYYQLYQEDGAFESRSPAYSNDRLVGRIFSKAVTPPHTATSVISHLCKIEGFAGLQSSAHLYLSLQSQTVLEGPARLALMSHFGPGSFENEPMVLLIKNAANRSPSGREPPAGLSENPANDTHYVYYRFYSKDGETASKSSFDVDDPALGRVNTLSVAPPFNVASLKARLARAEKIGAKNLQLCEDLSSDNPMDDSDDIPLLTDQYPGSTVNEPMAFICLDFVEIPASESPEITTQVGFNNALKSIRPLPSWPPIREGESLLLNGVPDNDPMEGPSRLPLEDGLESPALSSPRREVTLMHRAGVTLEERVEAPLPQRRQRGGRRHRKNKPKTST